MPTWKYIGIATAERRAALEAPMPFPVLVKSLKQNMRFACFHREQKQRDPSYARADFCVDIGHSLFDSFFNASTGYRGAYFESAKKGLAANQQLVGELSPVLIEWALAHDANVDRAWLAESMSLPTAKAWLGEDPVALCPACASGWSQSYQSDLHIANDRWEHSPHTHAKWGRQAPHLTKLRIFGGFVSDAHQEWVADHKLGRAQHIWEHGWT
jgi:hypothetical protein